jgi:preprotein translocase subunit SecA
LAAPGVPAQLQYPAPWVDGDPSQREARWAAGGPSGEMVYADPPRNAPCPCGSGKMYTRCQGDPRARVG